MKDLKKADNYKYRENERDDLMKKCQEIFNPPGVVHITETAYKKQSNIHPDIQRGVPQDSIWKRVKQEQKVAVAGTDAKDPPASIDAKTKSNANSSLKKIGTKVADHAVHDKDRLSALYKEHHLDVQLEKENANNVDF